MSSEFNLDSLRGDTIADNRYERRLAALTAANQETGRIRQVVDSAIANVASAHRSFVIYGEPQSGKTEMMIALTAKLLDHGFQIVVVLLNDSVQLLGQNLERFQRSGISPTPKKFSEVISPDITIGDHPWIIFSKKNAKDLEKLNEKLRRHPNKVVIDDEADYATPNSKINSQQRSSINKLTAELLGEKGIYIGVTATPGRLDLNRTHLNQNEFWIDFPPHAEYTGQEVFFPSTYELSDLKYRLSLLPDTGDYPLFLRNALFSFLVNVAYLNDRVNQQEQNYSILIHTSGKKVDHSGDYKEVVRLFEVLREKSNPCHEQYYKQIWGLAKKRYGGHEDSITRYILRNNERNTLVVMNSDKERNAADNRTGTSPSVPFTIIIGGNIVSRGVTFNHLLSMYFTRDVKHRLQQDTYVQRARMFGSRNSYLSSFELSIPRNLFAAWQQCFIFHRLSLESRRHGGETPVWLEGSRVTVTASGSIDKSHVVVDKGEMSFSIFAYDKAIVEGVLGGEGSPMDKLRALSREIGQGSVPSYLLDYIGQFLPDGDASIAIHEAGSIMGFKDADHSAIARSKGLIGQSQLKRFPLAIHHIRVFYNHLGMARVFYKYHGNVKFLKVRSIT
ncbi:MAG TPA: Z1 domain-containing protein [Thermoanaerobaculia bacterium]|nr:Z1 domain-containing protein [Thermoanaerobaculia bacterium]